MFVDQIYSILMELSLYGFADCIKPHKSGLIKIKMAVSKLDGRAFSFFETSM